MTDEQKASERYRELPREEPPRALDDAILAASRRAVHRRRGWYVPLAAAAAITLAVAVTLHVQHEKPGEEVDAVSPSMNVQDVPKVEAPMAQAPKAEEPRRAPRELRRDGPEFTPDPKPPAAPAPMRDQATAESELSASGTRSSADIQRAPVPQASAPATAPAESPRVAGAARGRSEASQMMAKAESPEQALERIAHLRAAGRHEEADRALAEFRKRHPGYRLSDETKAKVERRQ
jgi:hypothetical protein